MENWSFELSHEPTLLQIKYVCVIFFDFSKRLHPISQKAVHSEYFRITPVIVLDSPASWFARFSSSQRRPPPPEHKGNTDTGVQKQNYLSHIRNLRIAMMNDPKVRDCVATRSCLESTVVDLAGASRRWEEVQEGCIKPKRNEVDRWCKRVFIFACS